MKEVKLHVAGIGDFFEGAAAAGRNVDQGGFSEQAEIIAFESMEVLLAVLTANRWQLLRGLRQQGPTSIRHLSQLLKRDYRAVHADVHALMVVGLIERDDKGQISVPWERITAEMAIDLAA
jgi:predicted transcriptional regulator